MSLYHMENKVDFIKGIDSVKIKELSEIIRHAWNYYFFEYKCCQAQIHFTKEERSNYVGDLLNYFDDTIVLLSKYKMNEDYLSALYDNVAVLQFMYIQQDLLDELQVVFKLGKSQNSRKQPVRNLRNELIGHPIRRLDDKKNKRNELISSVFITAQSTNDKLVYIRYHKKNDYKFELISHNWQDLLSGHEEYVISCLKNVIGKIREVLSLFKIELINLKNKVSIISVVDLVDLVDKVYEKFYQNNYLFQSDNILYCFKKYDIHPRYQYAVKLYTKELVENIDYKIQDIDELLIDKNDVPISSEMNIDSEFIIKVSDITPNPHINYEFGKLLRKDEPIYGVDYFIRTYGTDKDVMVELNNMKINIDNDAEYYSSYEYLESLFKQRGLL